mgnify:CR=1
MWYYVLSRMVCDTIQKMSNTKNKVSETTVRNLLAGANDARELNTQMAEMQNGLILTDQDVANLESTVQLLQQQQERLNQAYEILNKLPSGIKAVYHKTDPNGRYRS